MSANVFFWIIPGPAKKWSRPSRPAQPVDPVHGQRGKQRSVHNTYFTLPVLFAMLCNHYSFTYSHPHNWLVLMLMMFAGAAIRQFFVMRHGCKLGATRHPLPYALVGRGGDLRPDHRLDAARARRRRRRPARPVQQRRATPRCRRCWSSAATCATARRCR